MLRHTASLLALAAVLVAAPAMAAPKAADADKAVAKIVASPGFKKAVAKLDADFDRTVADI
ncbi:MAG: peptidase M20, partial [Caulobacter sp.]